MSGESRNVGRWVHIPGPAHETEGVGLDVPQFVSEKTQTQG